MTRPLWFVGLTLLLASCAPRTAEGTAQAFCKQLNGGQWLKALGSLNDDDRVKQSLETVGGDERVVTEAMLGAARCQVQAMNGQTATIAFDAVDSGAIMRGLVGQSLGALFGGQAPDAQQVANQFQAKDAPRVTLTKQVELQQQDGKWKATPAGMAEVLDGMTGGMGGF